MDFTYYTSIMQLTQLSDASLNALFSYESEDDPLLIIDYEKLSNEVIARFHAHYKKPFRPRKTKSKHLAKLITISWDNEKMSIPDIVQASRKQSSYAMFSNFGNVFVIEQRSDNSNNFHGIHTHFLTFHSSIKKFKKELLQTFSKRNLIAQNFIDIQYLRTPRDCLNVLKYLLGEKSNTKNDPHKTTKQKIDILFRQKNNILHYYSNRALQKYIYVPDATFTSNVLQKLLDSQLNNIFASLSSEKKSNLII